MKTKILWICFDYNSAEPWWDSLLELNEYEVEIFHYNRIVPSDSAILDAADRFNPDIVIYTGTAGGPELPSPKTLARLRAKYGRSVFLSGDVGDPPWWPYIDEYRQHKCFDLYVNFDGNDNWPKQGSDYTALSPIAPSFFKGGARPHVERGIEFGFCGTYARDNPQDPRRLVLDPLRRRMGLAMKPWSPVYRTYHSVGEFLCNVKLTVNMPWSGSGQVTQVKARVFEAGLAGCCLLDHMDSQARHWYAAGEDYEVYESPEDAVEKARRLLAEPERMQEMATKLRKAVHARPARDFWKKIVDTVLKS